MNVGSVIEAYFAGEKLESAWIVLAGVLAFVSALALWFVAREPFARGLAAALICVATLGLVVGGTVNLRTDRQVSQLKALHTADPARFSAEEGARIATVVRSFAHYRYAYAGAVLLALILVFALARPWSYGLAVGLLVLAALGFTIDFYAEARARDYQRGLAVAGAIPPD